MRIPLARCRCGARIETWQKLCHRCQSAENEERAALKLTPFDKAAVVRRVYAVSVADSPDAPIKFGYTTNMTARLEQMQCGSPFPLVVLATDLGTRGNESFIHRALVDDRFHREWFRRSEAVMTLVTALQSGKLKEWIACAKQRR